MAKGKKTTMPSSTEEGIHKTVIFDRELLDRVEAVRKELRQSFTAACTSLIEQALNQEEFPSASNDLRFATLPKWFQAATIEMSKLTGLDPRAVLVDLLTSYMKEYMEKARHRDAEMSSALKINK